MHVPAGIVLHREENAGDQKEVGCRGLQDEEVGQHDRKRDEKQRLVDDADAPERGLGQPGKEEQGRAFIKAVLFALHMQHQAPFADAVNEASEEEHLGDAPHADKADWCLHAEKGIMFPTAPAKLKIVGTMIIMSAEKTITSGGKYRVP